MQGSSPVRPNSLPGRGTSAVTRAAPVEPLHFPSRTAFRHLHGQLTSRRLRPEWSPRSFPVLTNNPSQAQRWQAYFRAQATRRLDFIDNGVLVNCNVLPSQSAELLPRHLKNAPHHPHHQHHSEASRPYSPLRWNHITGPGPVTIDGVIAAGEDVPKRQHARELETPPPKGPVRQPLRCGWHTTRSRQRQRRLYQIRAQAQPARRTNLSSKGAGVGVQTMQTDLLKTAFWWR